MLRQARPTLSPASARALPRLGFAVALLALTGCVGRGDARSVRAVPQVRDTSGLAEVPPSVRKLEPLQLDRPHDAEGDALADAATTQFAAAIAPKRDEAFAKLLGSGELGNGARAVGVLPMTVEAQLPDGRFVHFVAETGRDWGTWSNLLAAGRLGVALGVSAAPDLALRTFDRKDLRAHMRPRDQRRGLPLWDDLKKSGPTVRGALFGVPTPEQRARFDRKIAWQFWSEALRLDAPAASTRKLDRELWARNERLRALAPQLSSLLVLDHLLGMRDRFGTEPIVLAGDKAGQGERLLALDLDGALDPRAGLDAKRKPGVAIKRVERFSRALITQLRGLDRAELARLAGVDDQGARLLDDGQLTQILARRDEVLKHVDGLIVKHGAAQVLCWD